MQPHGTPCWVDITTDLDRAKPFYRAVLGWNYRALPSEFGGWCMAEAAGAVVAALGPGDPRPWQVFFRADDLEATTAAVVAAGGTVTLPPGQVGEEGWAAVIEDPGGASVGLWKAGTHAGFGGMGGHGQPAWFEVNTRDHDGVRDFFAGLFELEPQKLEGMTYTTLHAEGRPRFGVLQMTEAWDGMDPSWSVYFTVDDTDAAVAAVRDNGGKVLHGPFDTPFGRMAVCQDPLGSVFHVIHSA